LNFKKIVYPKLRASDDVIHGWFQYYIRKKQNESRIKIFLVDKRPQVYNFLSYKDFLVDWKMTRLSNE
jgi:hypothetical protein|tara:strand:- start:649 stop:852 length:204 start_codon:yes stop_codon:yes gene_type:complete